MGFNIGVYPAQANNYPDCRYFIDRAFYDYPVASARSMSLS